MGPRQIREQESGVGLIIPLAPSFCSFRTRSSCRFLLLLGPNDSTTQGFSKFSHILSLSMPSVSWICNKEKYGKLLSLTSLTPQEKIKIRNHSFLNVGCQTVFRIGRESWKDRERSILRDYPITFNTLVL